MRVEPWPKMAAVVTYVDEKGQAHSATAQSPSWLCDMSDDVDELMDDLRDFFAASRADTENEEDL